MKANMAEFKQIESVIVKNIMLQPLLFFKYNNIYYQQNFGLFMGFLACFYPEFLILNFQIHPT